LDSCICKRSRYHAEKYLRCTYHIPENVYGEGDNIVLLARNDLSEDRPDVYEIISRYEMELSDIESIMLDLDQGLTQEDAAAK